MVLPELRPKRPRRLRYLPFGIFQAGSVSSDAIFRAAGCPEAIDSVREGLHLAVPLFDAMYHADYMEAAIRKLAERFGLGPDYVAIIHEIIARTIRSQ